LKKGGQVYKEKKKIELAILPGHAKVNIEKWLQP
jgi:hypothetical protein